MSKISMREKYKFTVEWHEPDREWLAKCPVYYPSLSFLHSKSGMALKGIMDLVYDEVMCDLAEEWHEGHGDIEIHEFLGISEHDYGLWVEDPDYIFHLADNIEVDP